MSEIGEDLVQYWIKQAITCVGNYGNNSAYLRKTRSRMVSNISNLFEAYPGEAEVNKYGTTNQDATTDTKFHHQGVMKKSTKYDNEHYFKEKSSYINIESFCIIDYNN